jgi:hypothetical protein
MLWQHYARFLGNDHEHRILKEKSIFLLEVKNFLGEEGLKVAIYCWILAGGRFYQKIS